MSEKDCGAIVILLKQNDTSKPVKSFSLRKRNYSFGSDVTCDIVIKRPDVEKLHCIVEVDKDGTAWIQPFAAAESMTINNMVLHEKRLLCDRDIFTISSRRFEYLKQAPSPKKKTNSEIQSESPSDSLTINSQLDVPSAKRKALESSGPAASLDFTDDATRSVVTDPFKKPKTIPKSFSANTQLLKGMTFVFSLQNKSSDIIDIVSEFIDGYGGKVLKEVNFAFTLHEAVQSQGSTKSLFVLCDTPVRSFKCLYALATGIPLLHYGYIEECITQDKVLNYKDFLMPLPSGSLKKTVMQRLEHRKLFAKGSAFFLDKIIDDPFPRKTLQMYKLIIEACGGHFCNTIEELLPMKDHKRYFLLITNIPTDSSKKIYTAFNDQILVSSIPHFIESVVLNQLRLQPLNQIWNWYIQYTKPKFESLPLRKIFEYLDVNSLAAIQRVSKKCREASLGLWSSHFNTLPSGVTINSYKQYRIFTKLQNLVNTISSKYAGIPLKLVECDNSSFYYLLASSDIISPKSSLKTSITPQTEVTILIGFLDNQFWLVDRYNKRNIYFTFEGIQEHCLDLCKYLESYLVLLQFDVPIKHIHS